MKQIKKRISWRAFYAAALVLFTCYVLLDAFVIPRSYIVVEQPTESETQSGGNETDKTGTSSGGTQTTEESGQTGSGESSGTSAQDTGDAAGDTAPVITDSSYSDGNININILQYRVDDTDVYVADVTLSSAEYLKTAFADDTFGKNITEKTTKIAEDHDAILAINGDYYSARSGYVIRNGILYREKTAGTSQEDLVIYKDGSFETISEDDVTAAELLSRGAQQVLSFGPGLVEDGKVNVSVNEEVDQAKASNPRTAIGIIGNLHYVFVVADGRTTESAGLSLYQLAEFLQGLNVKTAYNLDGGGSSTMCFLGSVVNNPTTNGNKISERSVSDIVYFG